MANRLINWMRIHRVKLARLFGIATALMVVITLWVYLMFPWGKLSDWLRAHIERSLGVHLSIAERHVRFPLQLVWEGVSLDPVLNRPPVSMKLERVTITWPIGSMIRRRLDLIVSVQLLGGEVTGELALRPTGSGVRYAFHGSGRGLDLAALVAWFKYPSEEIGGSIQFPRIEHEWINQDWIRGQGMVSMEATDVEHRGWQIGFARLSGTVTLKGGMTNLENISAQGNALDLVGSGNLLLRPLLLDSLLSFNSRMTLRRPTGPLAMLTAMATPDGHLDFAVRGILRSPTVYLNGTPFAPSGINRSGLRSGSRAYGYSAREWAVYRTG